MNSDIQEALTAAADCLRSFLESALPLLSNAWWSETVLEKLSDQQRQFAQQRGSTALEGLDLAALLRVMDGNWFELARELNLPIEGRNYLKELQTIRNRWAHLTNQEPLAEDIYRDLDTILRLLRLLDADAATVVRVEAARQRFLARAPAAEGPPPSASLPPEDAAPTFGVGQVVCLRSNPDICGAVVAVLSGGPETRYRVFGDGDTKVYYESQLQVTDEDTTRVATVDLSQFHAALSAVQIIHPSTSALYSLNAARVDYIPYQYRPVLKFVRAERPRLLIADSVGVGKTIEAGLILRELQARRDLQSVLVICPKALVTERKWELEMKRFDERFIPLDGEKLRYCLRELHRDGEWPRQHEKCIIPYSLFDERLLQGTAGSRTRAPLPGLLQMDPPPRFDLVMVDEAHHIRNTGTFAHQAVRFLCDHAEAVLFLTATPIQLGDNDLFVLLNTLRPDLVIDRQSFEHMAEPNPHINEAVEALRASPEGWPELARDSLAAALSTPWGTAVLQRNPEVLSVLESLRAGPLTPEKRLAAVRIVEEAHSFAGIINRTRRRDIGDFTIRRPETVSVPFTPAQRKLHDDLLATQAEVMAQLHGDQNVVFYMSTIRRQAASCIFGLTPFMGDILLRHLDDLDTEQLEDTGANWDERSVAAIEDKILDVLAQAEQLPPDDPKLEALRRIIADRQKLPNNKLMVFSTFRHTLRYLLEGLGRDDRRVGLVDGSTPDEERVALRDRFRLDRSEEKALDVLLFSEVGCEGLDYQFCDCIVNYDLPWNPMKVEQRIGRIDRFGQRSEFVTIYNLVTPDTVDADIYERCLLRIGVFNQSLGGSEEILGEIARDIQDIAVSLELTPEERRTKLDQLADNQIRGIQEQQRLEDQQAELFGLRLSEAGMNAQIDDATSMWLAPSALENLVREYLRVALGSDQEHLLGSTEIKSLRLSKENRSHLLTDYRVLPERRRSESVGWERWLKGGEPHLTVTFDANCAREDPAMTLLTAVHPLVRQAATALAPQSPVATSLSVVDDTLDPGTYPFAIYQWQYHGIRDDTELRPVCGSDDVAVKLLDCLRRGAAVSGGPEELPQASTFDDLDAQHYPLWLEERQAHQEHTRQMVRYRSESLKASHLARMAVLDEQLSTATNANIRRMQESQVGRAEADYARHMFELDASAERADITARPVAFGVVTVERGRTDGE